MAPCIDEEFHHKAATWCSSTARVWPSLKLVREIRYCVLMQTQRHYTCYQLSFRKFLVDWNHRQRTLLVWTWLWATCRVVSLIVSLHAYYTDLSSPTLCINTAYSNISWWWQLHHTFHHQEIPPVASVGTEAAWNMVFVLQYAPLKTSGD